MTSLVSAMFPSAQIPLTRSTSFMSLMNTWKTALTTSFTSMMQTAMRIFVKLLEAQQKQLGPRLSMRIAITLLNTQMTTFSLMFIPLFIVTVHLTLLTCLRRTLPILRPSNLMILIVMRHALVSSFSTSSPAFSPVLVVTLFLTLILQFIMHFSNSC